MSLGDRIHHDVAVEVPRQDHRPAGEERLADRQRAPQRSAIPLHRAFIRVELPPDNGMDPVAADQKIGLDAPDGLLSGPVDKVAPTRAVVVLTTSHEMVAKVDPFAAKSAEYRAMQHPEQLTSVDGDLRP